MEELKKILGLGRLDRNEIEEEMEQAEVEGTAPEMMRDPMGGFDSPIQDLQDIRKADLPSEMEDVIEKAKANRQAKSPNLKTKDELEKDNKELDLTAKYKRIMEDYEKAQKKEVEGPSFSEALPDILAGLYNIGVRANPTGLKQMKLPGTGAAAVKSRQATKARKLAEIDKTRSQILDLMKLQASADKAKKKSTYKFDDKIVEIQPDGTLKTLAKASSPKLGFAEKETIKAEAKSAAQEKKENREQRKLAVGALPKINEKLKQIKKAKASLKKYESINPLSGTGPIQNILPTITEKGQQVQADFNKLALDEMATIFSGMSKAIDSDAERAFFEKTQPTMSNEETVNMDLLEAMENRLIRNRDILESQVKNITPKGIVKEDPAQEVLKGSEPLRQQVERRTKDGRIAIFDAKTKQFIKYKD
jgi:hypothetical protein